MRALLKKRQSKEVPTKGQVGASTSIYHTRLPHQWKLERMFSEELPEKAPQAEVDNSLQAEGERQSDLPAFRHKPQQVLLLDRHVLRVRAEGLGGPISCAEEQEAVKRPLAGRRPGGSHKEGTPLLGCA